MEAIARARRTTIARLSDISDQRRNRSTGRACARVYTAPRASGAGCPRTVAVVSFPSTRSPFVGRQQELATLSACLGAVGEGHGRVVFVAGEPGIGKTRLLAEFASRARAEGWRIFAGRAYETEGMPPYLPFAEALREYIRSAPLETLGEHVEAAGSEIALITAEFRRRLPDIRPSPPMSSEHGRYRLFESVTDFLLRVAISGQCPSATGPRRDGRARGLLLILDDLHWADTPSLLLLQHLARRLSSAPLLVAGAYRTVELDRAHPLTTALAELRREGVSERLLLAPLAADAIAALIEAMIGATPAPAVVEAVERQTDGNAFFLGEVVRHLQAQGRDLTDPDAVTAEEVIPEGVREVVGQRLARLSAETNRMLEAIAVLGDGCGAQLLAKVSGLEDVAMLHALDEALRAGLVREEGAAYHFAHALIRQVVDGDLASLRRQHLHVRAAEAIAELHAANLEPQLARLASHYRLAGTLAPNEKRIDYAERAGAAAAAVCAYEEAHQQWTAALILLEAQAGTAERRARLLERRSDVSLPVLGQAAEAADLEEALRLYQGLGQREQAAQICARLGTAYCAIGRDMDMPRGLELLRAAETVLHQGPESVGLGELYLGLAVADLYGLRTGEGLAAAQRAMDIGGRLGDETLAGRASTLFGWLAAAKGRLAEGQALLEQRSQAGAPAPPLFSSGTAASWRGHLSRYRGDPRDAQIWFRRSLAGSRQGQAPLEHLTLARNLALAHVEAGELDAARPFVASELASHLALDAHVAFWEGDWASAAAAWSEGRIVAQRQGNRWAEVHCDFLLARLHFVRGEHADAAALLDEMLGKATDQDLMIDLAGHALLALVLGEINSTAQAQIHLTRCHEILAQGEDWRGLAGRVTLAEAVIAGAARGSEVDTLYDGAIARFRSFGLPWDEAEGLHYWARALGAAGQFARALDTFDAAIEVYRNHGAGEQWPERVLNDRRRLLSRPATSPSVPGYPGGLSAREVEVLRLIAAGQSNPQIAEALVISLNTVERHVNHIFGKTGTTNRVQAAIYAQQHELLQEQLRTS